MPIEHRWMDDEKTVVYIGLEGRVEFEDYFAGDARTKAMLQSVDHLVDVICDYSRQYYFAPGYAENVNKMDSIFHPRLRSAIFVGNKFAWELFDLYTQNYKEVSFIYAYAETMKEAHHMIEQIRAGKPIIVRRPSFPEWN